jgi:hypothetical protein
MTSLRNRGVTPDGSNSTSGNSHATGRFTQKTVIIEGLEEIQNPTEAHRYLEKTLLIVPPGQVISPSVLSAALHHVTEYKGVSKQAINAIRSIAYLLDEMEENALHETVRDTVTVQLNEFVNDMKEFATDTTKRVDKHINNKLSELSEAMKDLMDLVKLAFNDLPLSVRNKNRNKTPSTYKQALLHPPPLVDPRLAAKEGIRVRQFLLEGITRDSKFGKMNAAEAKKTVNQALESAGGNGLNARSTLKQNKTGLLVEMESDMGAIWLSDPAYAKALCSTLGPSLTFKQ